MHEWSEHEALVYVVDDDPAARESLVFLLESLGYRVSAFASAEAWLEEEGDTAANELACVILDVRMPGLSGLELQQELQRLNIGLPVVFISGHSSVRVAVSALRQGAFHFLEKPFDEQELIDQVNGALRQRRRQMDESVRQRDVDEIVALLTVREREVLERLERGDASKEIASALDISPRTVETHRANILSKTGERSIHALLARLSGSRRDT